MACWIGIVCEFMVWPRVLTATDSCTVHLASVALVNHRPCGRGLDSMLQQAGALPPSISPQMMRSPAVFACDCSLGVSNVFVLPQIFFEDVVADTGSPRSQSSSAALDT